MRNAGGTLDPDIVSNALPMLERWFTTLAAARRSWALGQAQLILNAAERHAIVIEAQAAAVAADIVVPGAEQQPESAPAAQQLESESAALDHPADDDAGVCAGVVDEHMDESAPAQAPAVSGIAKPLFLLLLAQMQMYYGVRTVLPLVWPFLPFLPAQPDSETDACFFLPDCEANPEPRVVIWCLFMTSDLTWGIFHIMSGLVWAYISERVGA